MSNQNGLRLGEARQSVEQTRSYLNKQQVDSTVKLHHQDHANGVQAPNHIEPPQWTDLQKDQLIANLSQKAESLAGEVLNLSDIIDSLMSEQKLAREKYVILKSRLNILDKHRVESIGSNNNSRVSYEIPQQTYSDYNKKEMYELLTHADNRSLTSPRRVISSIGLVYQDKLQSQWALRDRIGQLETELSNLRLQNTEYRYRLQSNNLLTFGKENTEADAENDQHNGGIDVAAQIAEQQQKQILLQQQQQYEQKQSSPPFQNYQSVDRMVHRYS